MKVLRRGAMLLAVALLAGCAGLPSGSAVPKQFLDRQIIVTLSEDVREHWQTIDREIQSRHGIPQVGEFPLTSIRVNCLVYRVPENRGLPTIVEALRSDRRIQLVQLNQVFENQSGGAGDPYAAMEYGIRQIGADRVQRTTLGDGVTVAVIDTGADKDHPDLKGRIVATQNFVEGGDVSFAQDGHGTAVAGIIGAHADDGVGILGVAPLAPIMVLKSCWYGESAGGKARCASWTLAKALDHAINQGARVINLSLAGPADALLEKLLTTADERGIVLIAAGAEGKPEPGFPATFPAVIPVVSSDAKGQVTAPAWLAQRSALAAPGVDIITTAPREGYDFLSGSSLATAHVSGVVALMLAVKPELRPADVRAILTKTARPAGAVGLIDACAALSALTPEAACR